MLLALDFAGDAVDVVSRPLKISFGTCGKRRCHIPHYLAVTHHGVWLIDIRPEALIKGTDREPFAAIAEVAVACGWRYAAAALWREHAFAGLDARASRRRLRFDPPGPVLLSEAADGWRFRRYVLGEIPALFAAPWQRLCSRRSDARPERVGKSPQLKGRSRGSLTVMGGCGVRPRGNRTGRFH
ncbi:hypothetical protein ABT116_18450 [Streptomyces sp. NPDC002130]|uniref:hypothetical protein n=1 Tax=Streptomyces sp. NPDC002130 TaxID=3155568 RepID=UPI00332E9590